MSRVLEVDDIAFSANDPGPNYDVIRPWIFFSVLWS